MASEGVHLKIMWIEPVSGTYIADLSWKQLIIEP